MEKIQIPTLGPETTDVAEVVKGCEKVVIDCGVIELSDERLSEMMKIARGEGVTDFILRNVCGQTLIGTGIKGPAKIDVHGLMGNHCAAFMDQTVLNTYATNFPNGVWCPGDAQVAIGNTSNPTELNIGGSVDDLFASYSPSGMFRVAGQGGNRCGLRGGAGVPKAWRQVDYDSLSDMNKDEIKEDLLYKYQLRKARLNAVGWREFLTQYERKVENREPPTLVFGRKVRDYFMEYAQGTIGVILNVYDIDDPAGYYICSGMTAGTAYIRGKVSEDRLGERVKFAPLTDEDAKFLRKVILDFHETFHDRMNDEYKTRIDALKDGVSGDSEEIISQFNKITPAG